MITIQDLYNIVGNKIANEYRTISINAKDMDANENVVKRLRQWMAVL